MVCITLYHYLNNRLIMFLTANHIWIDNFSKVYSRVNINSIFVSHINQISIDGENHSYTGTHELVYNDGSSVAKIHFNVKQKIHAFPSPIFSSLLISILLLLKHTPTEVLANTWNHWSLPENDFKIITTMCIIFGLFLLCVQH